MAQSRSDRKRVLLPNSFANNVDWNKITVVFPYISAKTARHPTPDEINTKSLPDSMRFCGYVDSAEIPTEGQARLNGRLILTDPEVETLAKNGALGLSTGIIGDTLEDATGKRLTGTITPNHVLVFEQGVRPGFFPRDNGALFLTMRSEDDIMTDTFFNYANITNHFLSHNILSNPCFLLTPFHFVCTAGNHRSAEPHRTPERSSRSAIRSIPKIFPDFSTAFLL